MLRLYGGYAVKGLASMASNVPGALYTPIISFNVGKKDLLNQILPRKDPKHVKYITANMLSALSLPKMLNMVSHVNNKTVIFDETSAVNSNSTQILAYSKVADILADREVHFGSLVKSLTVDQTVDQMFFPEMLSRVLLHYLSNSTNIFEHVMDMPNLDKFKELALYVIQKHSDQDILDPDDDEFIESGDEASYESGSLDEDQLLMIAQLYGRFKHLKRALELCREGFADDVRKYLMVKFFEFILSEGKDDLDVLLSTKTCGFRDQPVYLEGSCRFAADSSDILIKSLPDVVVRHSIDESVKIVTEVKENHELVGCGGALCHSLVNGGLHEGDSLAILMKPTSAQVIRCQSTADKIVIGPVTSFEVHRTWEFLHFALQVYFFLRGKEKDTTYSILKQSVLD